MKAILTVIGKDRVGIIAQVSQLLAKYQVNIVDVSQTIMDDNFVMMMMVTIPLADQFAQIDAELENFGNEAHLEVKLRNTKLFEAMHNI
ncbi:ACT domain-containing protein [Lactobacillus alvi]|uniref:UPF0237 protein H5993_00110 n=1 Tax=Limosilactobacillus alvi TaxID=990412 RepID=A0ABS2EM74_9LACO|nr:ACT domain-containing protein [Limosilactobacillus alvi]MBM6753171.1 ACT domain-containing protein [Limosilactobacillus alvi]HJA73522.1 ACT domain-containing protein [Candidatus Limosilactobacillus faecipullorum]